MICYDEIPLDGKTLAELRKLEIEFAFQPIFDSRNMEVFAYEALLRPKGKTPLQLIREYQERGLLNIIELATCFGAPMAYRRRGYDKFLCINSFPSEVLTDEQHTIYYERYPEMQSRLIVEIVEYTNLAMQKWERKRADIRAHQIRVSLDDFGTGNNDLSFVDLLAPDIVKLDRSLLSDIDLDREKQEKCVLLTEHFHGRGIKVVAEGIETPGELSFLKAAGADYLQGYLLGRPW